MGNCPTKALQTLVSSFLIKTSTEQVFLSLSLFLSSWLKVTRGNIAFWIKKVQRRTWQYNFSPPELVSLGSREYVILRAENGIDLAFKVLLLPSQNTDACFIHRGCSLHKSPSISHQLLLKLHSSLLFLKIFLFWFLFSLFLLYKGLPPASLDLVDHVLG